MKKLFGNREKPTKPPSKQSEGPSPIPTPIHQAHATIYQPPGGSLNPPSQPPNVRRPSVEDDRWDVVSHHDSTEALPNPHSPGVVQSKPTILPPGASPPLQSPRPVSPYTSNASIRTTRDAPQLLRKQSKPNNPVPVAALGILRSLDPHAAQPETLQSTHPSKTISHERLPSDAGHGEKREKRSFWSRDKDKERERERERENQELQRQQMEREKGRDRAKDRARDDDEELPRMIGYLTATASEDWALVLEVCERASVNEHNAKEAAKALRSEFKYGEPSAQLSAARLWAIMLRNSSELFISQSTSRKFLDTLEDLIMSPRTSPVVRERVMDVLAAAAYASGSKKDAGFRGLWRKVKPPGRPDEGIPFDTDDAMFNPPASSKVSQYEGQVVNVQHPSEATLLQAPPKPNKKRKSPSRNRIVPPEEDIRRLFQECKIGLGNASLLSQALVMAQPEDLKKRDVVKEFYLKCRSSQELISTQIDWATAGAERSRASKLEALRQGVANMDDMDPEDHSPVEMLTVEEELLAALLAANAELQEALKQYDDLQRVAVERKVEHLSRKELRINRQLHETDGDGSSDYIEPVGGSRSREPSPVSSMHSRPGSILLSGADSQGLAPPPHAPAGPRSPALAHTQSRTPSPITPADINGDAFSTNGYETASRSDHGFERPYSPPQSHIEHDELDAPIQPSAKALGKRRQRVEDVRSVTDSDDLYEQTSDPEFMVHENKENDDEELGENGWGHQNAHTPHFVYDAVAERAQQRRTQDENVPLVNGVH